MKEIQMIEINQTCDGCGNVRQIPLQIVELAGSVDLDQRGKHAGWRQVSANSHLCLDCIRKAVNP